MTIRARTFRSDRLTREGIEVATRLGVLALLLYWSFVLIRPFLVIAIWSVVLCVALYPLYEQLVRRLGGRRKLAAVLLTALSLIVLIGPVTWLVLDVIDSLGALSTLSDLSSWSPPPPSPKLKQWPILGEQVYQFWDLASTNLRSAIVKSAPLLRPLGRVMLDFAADASVGVLKFFAAVILAGVLFAPAPSLLAIAKRFLRRLASEQGERLLLLAASTIRTVSRGVIGIATLQALLLGIGFSVAGVPGASFLTAASLVLAIVQVGPAIVVIPAIVWAWSTLTPAAAAAFTAYTIPVNLMDNVLRPLVMARGLPTPMLVVLIGVIGGTISYGLMGLFLGPIVLSVFWELFVNWIDQLEDEGVTMASLPTGDV